MRGGGDEHGWQNEGGQDRRHREIHCPDPRFVFVEARGDRENDVKRGPISNRVGSA